MLDREAGGVREVLSLPVSTTRRLFEHIETLEAPATNLRIGRMNGFLFRSMLRFHVPVDSIATAAGGTSGADVVIDSMRVQLEWFPQEGAYLFHEPGVGDFAVHRPEAFWNEASVFHDTTGASEVAFPSSAMEGVTIEQTDSLATIRLPIDALRSAGTAIDSVEILLEPSGSGEFMLAAHSSEASLLSAGRIPPRIVIDYRVNDQALQYETAAIQDISWGGRDEGGPPEDLVMISSGLRLSPILEFAFSDTIPRSATVNFAQLEFTIDMEQSLFDIVPIQLDAVSVASTGDTVYTTFTTSSMVVLNYTTPEPEVVIPFSQTVVRNWLSGVAQNLGMALRVQFDSNLSWIVIKDPRVSFNYTLAPEVQ